MKNLFIKYLIIATIGLALFSCKKEYPYPTKEYTDLIVPPLDGPKIGRWGKFLLLDATMFVENLETGEKYSFSHFDATKKTSSLRWGGSLFDIEEIIQDSTTYSFWEPVNYPGIGKFQLNSDTTHFYGVSYVGSYQSIVEDPTHGQQNMGGSSRPFEGYVIDGVEKIIIFRMHDAYGSIDGYNVRYRTSMKFKKIEEW